MRLPLLPALCCIALAGCGKDPAPAPAQPAPQPSPTAAQPTAAPAPNTRPVRAADAVGYDGAAIQRSIDRVEQQAAEHVKAAEAAGADGR